MINTYSKFQEANGIKFNDDDLIYYRDHINFKKQLSKELGYKYTGNFSNEKKELPIAFDGGYMYGTLTSSNIKNGECADINPRATYGFLKKVVINYLTKNREKLEKEGYLVLLPGEYTPPVKRTTSSGLDLAGSTSIYTRKGQALFTKMLNDFSEFVGTSDPDDCDPNEVEFIKLSQNVMRKILNKSEF